MTAGGADRRRRALLAALAAAAAHPPLRAEPEPQRLRWRQLLPRGWTPAAYFSQLPADDVRDWAEDDPRARQRLARLIELGRDVPAARVLHGRRVQIPGFVLPLAENGDGSVPRFLLVPYQGACVHTPPPPANQAVWVDAAPPLPAALVPYPLWVQGRIEVERRATRYLHTVYRMQAERLTPFDESADRSWLPRYSVF